MQTRSEQARIRQLIGTYSPHDAPRLPLDFGDFLSILWRLDRCAAQPKRERYYRQCAYAVSSGLGLIEHPVSQLVRTTPTGHICAQLPNLPYRSSPHLIDAQDRKAAITQLIALRGDTLRIGTYEETWGGTWPGSGILDTELRERVFAVLFTARQGQFSTFGRLLLVVDIVLGNLILGFGSQPEISLNQLIAEHHFPDPVDARVINEYAHGE